MAAGLRRGISQVLAALLACGTVAQACQFRPINVRRALYALEASGPKQVACPQANTVLVAYTCTSYPKLRPPEVVRLLGTIHRMQAVPNGQSWTFQVLSSRRITVSPSGPGTLVTLRDHLTAQQALFTHLGKALLRAPAFVGKAVPTCAQLGVKDNAQFTFQKCTVSWPPERRAAVKRPQYGQVTTPLITFRLRRVKDHTLQAGVMYVFGEETSMSRLEGCGTGPDFRLDILD